MFSGIGRVVVLVKDQEEALAFYRDVLGLTVLHDQTIGGYRYLHIGVPGQDGVGLWLMPEHDDARIGQQSGDQPLLVLYTDDLDTVRSTLMTHDVEIWADQEDAHSRSLHFRDLYGNVIIAAQLLS
ncbi:VOC family protein [Phytoactinopolyspora halotolerans]|uniref:VOC domain-containing protein n=1 Tax=Phytoactinopolyspora halotolerans TaxID=1981512 RepID=A0A6L9S7V9_9ACTN|nr:VOC family protein [Phytoactinopolyspora halotolerans]NEE00060.1 hypothetical protein [Phytoactinopolyspora halotolerans]